MRGLALPSLACEEKPSAVMGSGRRLSPTACPLVWVPRARALGRMASPGGRFAPGRGGYVIVPDADSAVNLTVYAPRWINPEDLLSAMRERAEV